MMAKNNICAIINLTEDTTQLKPLTNNRPIAGLPFAGRYRIIDFMLSDLAYAKIESVGLFIGESGRSIYDHVRSGAAWDLQSEVAGGIFTFSHQDWKRNNPNAHEYEDFYYNHRLFLERSKSEYVFVAGSKIIANLDIIAVRKQHIQSGKDVTVVYKHFDKNQISDQELLAHGIVFDGDDIEKFTDYVTPSEDGKVNLSLNMYLLGVDKMLSIIDKATEEGVYLELNELLQHYSTTCSLNSFEYTGYASNIDTIDKYYKANMELLSFPTFASLFQTSIPILTKTKHGSPTYYSPESEVRESFVGSDTFISGTVKRSVLNRRVVVEKDAIVMNSILLQGTKVGEGAQIEYAILDKNTTVEAGAKIIGSPDDIKVIGKNSHIYAD
ncbi:glucose-1-phosphate adenylyltransferase subunit GlgD [Ruoffia tabacinasalis]|nr:glucose-1-phosphate adenylyltransferase subunit GlgD [Ruoffia tabacinasalis]